ncbi:hypothetical protein LMH73_004530 [Vibrio splendidus]|nr:hypothetical protein [Vibrio splendidus]MCC4883255.1 hypothetical protein [Vibrio splendidus]
MPACKDEEQKYLRELSEGIQIEIPQVDYKELISYRQNGGVRKARQKAKEIRDKQHERLLGREVSKQTIHTKKRKSKRDESLLPVLPVGLSYGYSRGKLLYVVFTCKDKLTQMDKKYRFNIKLLGLDLAINLAKQEKSKIKETL